MRFETFERLTFFGQRYYFRMVAAGNNEIIAASQAYKSPRDRDLGIAMIRHGAFEASVREGTR